MIIILVAVLLCACSAEDGEKTPASEPSKEPEVQVEQENNVGITYVGDYASDPVYQEILKIESSTDPEEVCAILGNLYGEEFSYVKLERADSDEEEAGMYVGYKEPYDDILCSSTGLFNTRLGNMPIYSDTYLFLRAYNETPAFVMDCDGTYIVSSYEIHQFDDGTSGKSISSWVMTDLFLSLHGFTDESEEDKAVMEEVVRTLDYYMELEELIRADLGISDTDEDDSASASDDSTQIHGDATIDILSVEYTGDPMYPLYVEYKINNIADSRGCVYLSCDAHAYSEQMFFNDENHVNEYRADGIYDYELGWMGEDAPNYFNIYYGYGTFDTSAGWSNSVGVKMFYRFVRDHGTITSNTIPEDEIHQIYDGDTVIGAWTLHPSGDLIEAGSDSSVAPFGINSAFTSPAGNTVGVTVEGDNLVFSVNGTTIGSPRSEPLEVGDNGLLYEVDADNGTYLFTRHAKDSHITVSVAGQLPDSLEGDYYP